MAWNRPSTENQQPTRKSGTKAPSAWRGVVTGLVVVVLGLVLFFVFSGAGEAPRKRTEKRTTSIGDVKPANIRKPEGSDPARPRIAKPKTVAEAMSNLETVSKPKKLPRVARPIDLSTYPKNVYGSGTEQLVSWVFNVEFGDMPLPIPPLAEKEKKNVVGLLLGEMEIKPDDDEETRKAKENINEGKKAMLKFIKEGGDPDEFLQYCSEEQQRAFQFRMDALKQANELRREDPELAKQFVEKVNEKLSEQGIKGIQLRKTLEEMRNEKKNRE